MHKTLTYSLAKKKSRLQAFSRISNNSKMSVAVGGRHRSRSRSGSKALKDCRKKSKRRGLGDRRLGRLVSDLKDGYPREYALLAAKGRIPRVNAKGRAEKDLASKHAARGLAKAHRREVADAHKQGAGKNAYIKACDKANKRVLDAVKAAGIDRRFKYKGNTYEVQTGLPKRVAGHSLSDNKYSNAADLLAARQRNMKAAVAKRKATREDRGRAASPARAARAASPARAARAASPARAAPKKKKAPMSAAEKAAANRRRQVRMLNRLKAGHKRSRSCRRR